MKFSHIEWGFRLESGYHTSYLVMFACHKKQQFVSHPGLTPSICIQSYFVQLSLTKRNNNKNKRPLWDFLLVRTLYFFSTDCIWVGKLHISAVMHSCVADKIRCARIHCWVDLSTGLQKKNLRNTIIILLYFLGFPHVNEELFSEEYSIDNLKIIQHSSIYWHSLDLFLPDQFLVPDSFQ